MQEYLKILILFLILALVLVLVLFPVLVVVVVLLLALVLILDNCWQDVLFSFSADYTFSINFYWRCTFSRCSCSSMVKSLKGMGLKKTRNYEIWKVFQNSRRKLARPQFEWKLSVIQNWAYSVFPGFHYKSGDLLLFRTLWDGLRSGFPSMSTMRKCWDKLCVKLLLNFLSIDSFITCFIACVYTPFIGGYLHFLK